MSLVYRFGLVDHKRRSATCTAMGTVKLASLPASAFTMLNNTHAPLAYCFQHLVALQLAHDARNLNQLLLDAISKADKSGVGEMPAGRV